MNDLAAVLDQWSRAAERLLWDRPWTSVFEPDDSSGRWFGGGELNAAANLVDRHDRPCAGRDRCLDLVHELTSYPINRTLVSN